MYCLSVGNKNFNSVLNIIPKYEMAEIRLDLCHFNYIQIEELFKSHKNLIATFRNSTEGDAGVRLKKLIFAIKNGAAWVDLDYDSNTSITITYFRDLCKEHNSRLILSHHNYTSTPDTKEIEEKLNSIKKCKPYLSKLVFTANTPEDNKRVLSLYENHKNLLAFNMGELGKETRYQCLKLGAPYTYISDANNKTAEGQMTLDEIMQYS